MKKILLLLPLFIAIQAQSAEFLIRAKGSWNDGIDTSGMTADELRSYNARSQKGDIVSVRPDGFVWGSAECLPDFILVKVPGVDDVAARQYVNALYDTTDLTKPILIKRRRYRVPKNYIDGAIAAGGVVTFTNAQLISRIKDKLSQ